MRADSVTGRIVGALARTPEEPPWLAALGGPLSERVIADLTYAFLTGANLAGANLTDGLLGDADLADADLSDHWLATRLEGVTWSEGTQWPTGVHSQVRTRSQSVRPGVYQVDPGGNASAP